MEITDGLSETAVLAELAGRLVQTRIQKGLTQAVLAQKAGVAKRTLERFEAGEVIGLDTLIKLLGALGLKSSLQGLLPEPGESPLKILGAQQKARKRASTPRSEGSASRPGDWVWGEDEG